jgi:branched-subunit amino acid ABC-type transport system permease component
MSQFIAATGFGLVNAAIFALGAVGFTLQFSVTNVLNIAFGAIMSLSAFIAYDLNVVVGANIWLALAIASVACGVLSVLLNRGLIQPFLKRGTNFFGMVVVTIALDLIVEYAIEAIWGPTFLHYNVSPGNPVSFGSLTFTHFQLVAIGIAIAGMIAIQLLLKRTRLGKAMRATSNDAKLSKVCGIRTSRIHDAGWFISGALAGVAGVILGLTLGTFSFTIGDEYLILIIAAAMLGGIGQANGAMLGALIIGLVTQWSSLVISGGYSEVVAFMILILVLLLRPTGIVSGIAADRSMAG